jgi:hypothetical protein
MLDGTYIGDAVKQAAKLENVLKALDNEHQHDIPIGEYVSLTASNRIINCLASAHATGDITVIYGHAGLSRTTSARHYAKTHAPVFMVTMSPCVTTPFAVLRRLASAMELGDAATTAARLEEEIVVKLTDIGALLIVDEAHHLTPILIDTIRIIHDATGCGLALIGNAPLWGRISTGSRMGQLVSRAGTPHKTNTASPDDVKLLLHALVPEAEEKMEKVAVNISRRPGRLRAVTKAINICRRATRDGSKITAEMLGDADAARSSGGDEDAE